MISLASVTLFHHTFPVEFLIGLGVVGLASFALWFTSYRYLVVYFVLGMVYWLLVEGVQSLIVSTSNISVTNSYLIAMGILLVASVGLLYWLLKSDDETEQSEKQTYTKRINVGNRPLNLQTDTDYSEQRIRHHSTAEH